MPIAAAKFESAIVSLSLPITYYYTGTPATTRPPGEVIDGRLLFLVLLCVCCRLLSIVVARYCVCFEGVLFWWGWFFCHSYKAAVV